LKFLERKAFKEIEITALIRICPRLNKKIAVQVTEYEPPLDEIGAEFACPLCGKGFVSENGLNKHVS
jgi:hypothetical protein